MNTNVPPPFPPLANPHAKLLKELCIFFIGMGVLLAIPAYFVLSGALGNAQPLWGVARQLAIGLPVAIISAIHLLAGILLAIRKGRLFVILGAIASTLIAVFYFVFMFPVRGSIPINLITVVAVAIPIAAWTRTINYLIVASNTKWL